MSLCAQCGHTGAEWVDRATMLAYCTREGCGGGNVETRLYGTLCQRAWRNLRHMQESSPTRCVLCTRHTSRVNEDDGLVTCGHECRGRLFQMERFFQVMLPLSNGGSGGVKRLRQPDLNFEWSYMPPEILAEIILWAYRYALHSREEYDELMEMSKISKTFAQAIKMAIPRFVFLARWVFLRGEEAIRQFHGLETLRLGGDNPNLFGICDSLKHFPNLTKLTLGFAMIPSDTRQKVFAAVRALAHLRILSLGAQTLPADCLKGMTTLEHLDLQACQGRAPIGVENGLRSLYLFNVKANILLPNLSELVSLTELDIGYETTVEGSLAGLTNLLTLHSGGGLHIDRLTLQSLANLRHLTVNRRTEYSVEDLNAMTSLTSLRIKAQNYRNLLHHISRNQLRTLIIDNDESGSSPVIPPRVEYFELHNAILAISDFSAFDRLTVLRLENGGIHDDALQSLVSLRHLFLIWNRWSTFSGKVPSDAGISSLVNLEMLFLQNARNITYSGISKCTGLRELYLQRDDDLQKQFAKAGGEKAEMLYTIPNLRYLMLHVGYLGGLSREEMKAARALDVTVLDAEWQPVIDGWWPDSLRDPCFSYRTSVPLLNYS